MCVLGFCTYTVGIHSTLCTWKSMYQETEQQLIFIKMALYPISASECQQMPDIDKNGPNFPTNHITGCHSEGVTMQRPFSVWDFSEEAPSVVSASD